MDLTGIGLLSRRNMQGALSALFSTRSCDLVAAYSSNKGTPSRAFDDKDFIVDV
jgi:hypothetical protein